MLIDNVYSIKHGVYNEMIHFCKQQLPYEACGLISGLENTGVTLRPVENPLKSHFRFSISEQTIERVYHRAKLQNEIITGIFHSHPSTSAYPSRSDIKNNPYSNLAYIIVSFKRKTPDVRAYKIINREKVVTLKIIII